ncbi:MAG: hypothetical protein GX989_05990 [Firmicutes bacterium]|nr:hypothetical protein [Bacillota bacterium]
MHSIGIFPFSILIIAMILYFGGIYLLTKGERKYLGFVLPCIFALITFTQEGIYMTFFGMLSILGFIVYGTINYLSR